MLRSKAAFAGVAALTTLGAGFALATGTEADAQARNRTVITYHHPASVTLMPGGQRDRQVDCDQMKTIPGSSDPKALYATCEWYEQLDPNGQNFCSATDKLPVSPTARVNAFSQATLQAVTHAADFHGDCVAQAGSIAQRQGRNPSAMYGSNWQSRRQCSITAARDQCRQALGLTNGR